VVAEKPTVNSSTYVKVLDRMKGHLMKKPGAPSTQLSVNQDIKRQFNNTLTISQHQANEDLNNSIARHRNSNKTKASKLSLSDSPMEG
jgi:phage regulator Rha-like protein